MSENNAAAPAVEFAKAVAWPTATIVVALVIAFVVWLILARRGAIDFSVWDKFKFTARSSEAPDSQSPVEVGDPVLVPEATLGVPEAQPQIEELPAADVHADVFKFAMPKSAVELEAGYAYIREHWLPFDQELWETVYAEKKFALGSGGGDEELRRLSDSNPRWVVPLAHLIRRAVLNHDLDVAEAAYSAGVARLPSQHIDVLLSDALRMRYRLRGARSALEFLLEWANSDLTDDLKSSLLVQFGELLKGDGDVEGYRVALELSLTLMPARAGSRFAVAYSYGDSATRWPATLHHYREIALNDSDYAMAENNRGVALRAFDKELEVEAFERGMASGNPLSASNLARMLIDEGFVSAGERLLAGIEDEGSAVEHISRTRAAALASRRRMEQEDEKVSRCASAQFGLFRSTVLQSFRHLKSTKIPQRGVFASSDLSVRILIENAGAACRIISGTLTYDGVLRDQQFCHSGILKAEGKGGLLDFHSMDVALFAISGDGAKLVKWPPIASIDSKIEIVELVRSSVQPALGGVVAPLLPG